MTDKYDFSGVSGSLKFLDKDKSIMRRQLYTCLQSCCRILGFKYEKMLLSLEEYLVLESQEHIQVVPKNNGNKKAPVNKHLENGWKEIPKDPSAGYVRGEKDINIHEFVDDLRADNSPLSLSEIAKWPLKPQKEGLPKWKSAADIRKSLVSAKLAYYPDPSVKTVIFPSEAGKQILQAEVKNGVFEARPYYLLEWYYEWKNKHLGSCRLFDYLTSPGGPLYTEEGDKDVFNQNRGRDMVSDMQSSTGKPESEGVLEDNGDVPPVQPGHGDQHGTGSESN